MSNDSPTIDISLPGVSIAVVATLWNAPIVDKLVEGAISAIELAGASFEEFRVAGAFELPLLVSESLKTYDAAIALGVVIRGDTAHFDYICTSVTDGLTEVVLKAGKPVGFGVLMVETLEQALQRVEPNNNKGKESAEAVLLSLKQLSELRGSA